MFVDFIIVYIQDFFQFFLKHKTMISKFLKTKNYM
jgi:hypothetical protein